MAGEIDLVEILFTLFWLFFIALVLYIHREGKREGYPLVSDRTERAPGVSVEGFPRTPPKKRYMPAHGDRIEVPRDEPARELALEPAAAYPGAPFVPTGNPMIDAVGPATYADRADVPDLTLHGENRIVPMRVATDFVFFDEDPEPIGMEVIDAAGKVAGTVADVWVDRGEPLIVFYEVDLGATGGNKRVLLPVNFCRVKGAAREIHVNALYADQFADVPQTASPDCITLLEEDKITGYYGGGLLYADEKRQAPIL